MFSALGKGFLFGVGLAAGTVGCLTVFGLLGFVILWIYDWVKSKG